MQLNYHYCSYIVYVHNIIYNVYLQLKHFNLSLLLIARVAQAFMYMPLVTL